jgi:homoserine dehydrogenase
MELRIALTGFGNVGQGLASLLRDHAEEYRDRYGVRIVLTGVADRGGAVVEPGGLAPDAVLQTKHEHGSVSADGGIPGLRGSEFLDAAEASVLVEAASTSFEDAEPGWGYVQAALERRMDIVLASKGVLVLHYDELMASARSQNVRILFSATVGAPVPLLELASHTLVGVRIHAFEGIVNATTSQILSSMAEGLTYEQGVQAAQAIGVAETDPTLDVDGWDAAAKAVIIAHALFGAGISLDDVSRKGIRGVSTDDLLEASSRGRTIKLVARVRREADGVRASVAPEERDLTDPLGRLGGQEMGVVLSTELLGEVTSSVERTGGVPTALTVLRDLVNLARDQSWLQER